MADSFRHWPPPRKTRDITLATETSAPLPDDHDGLVSGLLLDGKGGAREVEWPEIQHWTPDQGVLWVHLNRTKDEAEHYVREQAGLDDVVIDALLATDTRPRMVTHGAGMIVIMRGINLNPGADPEDMISIRIWVEKKRIVSTRSRRSLATRDVQEALARGQGPKDEVDCLFELAKALHLRVTHVIDELSDAVDALEEQVVDGEISKVRDDLSQARKRAISLRRHLAPQREAFTRLQAERHEMLDGMDSVHFREIADETTRFVEELDTIRERASVVQDEVMNRLTERQNRNSYVLTVVAAIMLPLSFITSLFGVSLSNIPLSDDPNAFWILVGMLVVLIAAEVALFRWTRWL
jgi:zinc transporter